jgi:hypothetical protein
LGALLVVDAGRCRAVDVAFFGVGVAFLVVDAGWCRGEGVVW